MDVRPPGTSSGVRACAVSTTAVSEGALGTAWGDVDHLINISSEDPGDGLAEATVLPCPGLRTVDMGHGRTRSAETLKMGDKMGMAAQNNDLIKVKTLLRRGATINARNAASGVTPLGVAAERGHLQMVHLLLKGKAQVDDATNDGMTPLHICSQFGQTEVVQALVAAGADVNTVASRLPRGHEDHSTPLMSAVVRNSLPTIKALVAAKADVNLVPPRSGDSALHVACRLGRHKTIPLLLDSGAANTRLRNKFNETPLESALVSTTTSGHFCCIDLLKPLLAEGDPAPLADKSNTYICACMTRLSLHVAQELHKSGRDQPQPGNEDEPDVCRHTRAVPPPRARSPGSYAHMYRSRVRDSRETRPAAD